MSRLMSVGWRDLEAALADRSPDGDGTYCPVDLADPGERVAEIAGRLVTEWILAGRPTP